MKNYIQKRNSYPRDPFFDAFDDFFKPVFYDESYDSMRTDIKETDDGYQLAVEMPGFDKKDIKVSLENGYLTVSATKSSKEEENKDKKERYIRKEFFLKGGGYYENFQNCQKDKCVGGKSARLVKGRKVEY